MIICGCPRVFMHTHVCVRPRPDCPVVGGWGCGEVPPVSPGGANISTTPTPQEHVYIYLRDGESRLLCDEPPHELPPHGKLR